ncbi:hypothetical protein ACFVTC_30530 [Streptomyces sp. NPDC057950]|uniref:hypothetical protein n=1 Tax=Streptomyces sp. NPDC057950 TaxID=3346288 RepID=UPI0036EB10AB
MGEQFEVGTTCATERFRGPDAGGLDLGGNGRGRNGSTGEFTVSEPALDGDGTVKAFAATFVQHRAGGTPALRGARSTATPDSRTAPAGR